MTASGLFGTLAFAPQLCEQIERHRDVKYGGSEVHDPLDSALYNAALWYRSMQEADDEQ